MILSSDFWSFLSFPLRPLKKISGSQWLFFAIDQLCTTGTSSHCLTSWKRPEFFINQSFPADVRLVRGNVLNPILSQIVFMFRPRNCSALRDSSWKSVRGWRQTLKKSFFLHPTRKTQAEAISVYDIRWWATLAFIQKSCFFCYLASEWLFFH